MRVVHRSLGLTKKELERRGDYVDISVDLPINQDVDPLHYLRGLGFRNNPGQGNYHSFDFGKIIYANIDEKHSGENNTTRIIVSGLDKNVDEAIKAMEKIDFSKVA